MEFGVRREDLDSSPALDGDGGDPTISLTSQVHPVFALERFSNSSKTRILPKDIYYLRNMKRMNGIPWQKYPVRARVI